MRPPFGHRVERATRRNEHHFPNPSRRWRLRQSLQLDLRRHAASPEIGVGLRSRRQDSDLRQSTE